ncbi:NADH-quinone oxidoreductase subunit J [Sinimarinibacterium flocculans]|uniref:NADH-quinone oxidoreductase subunit J n=1 Tax=Sinimarinibacterium flocculans TaxID=985250 RepID=A0A318E577_9GAMM|nr:NADH-quinone oxidoreductase subunit J [Sinimarinibacterium flocculans]PXV65643.1 NADH dehydrogenase subunit J [Sinimarinibacterium flocculans]
MDLLFSTCAAIAVLATALAISRPDPVHALLNLIVSLLATAGVMFSLGAALAAALQVLVYAGAIMVLFVFVVMLLNAGPEARERERRLLRPRYWLLPSAMCAVLLAQLLYGMATPAVAPAAGIAVEAKAVGIRFYGPYLLAVELGSFLLLAGLVAAWRIGRMPERTA